MEGTFAEALKLKLRKEEVDETQTILNDIEEIKKSIKIASSRFENQSDPDLVEACIYEMQALSARYRYLTREARRLGLKKSSLFCLEHME